MLRKFNAWVYFRFPIYEEERELSDYGNVFKIGSTADENMFKRADYRNRNVLIMLMRTYESMACERAIRAEFKKYFVQLGHKKDFFSGDGALMAKVFNKVVIDFNCKYETDFDNSIDFEKDLDEIDEIVMELDRLLTI